MPVWQNSNLLHSVFSQVAYTFLIVTWLKLGRKKKKKKKKKKRERFCDSKENIVYLEKQTYRMDYNQSIC